MINPDYEITDEDIESVLNWLKINKPEKANRENAEFLLEEMYVKLHIVDKLNPKIIEELAEKLK